MDNNHVDDLYGFNTQPPEGGWSQPIRLNELKPLFQHTAA